VYVITFETVLLIAAFVVLLVSTSNISVRINLQSLGLALLVLAVLLRGGRIAN
jgi:hypothetical protein